MSNTLSNILGEQYRNLAQVAEFEAERYQTAEPFPSISFKNFFNPDFLSEVLDEFPDLSKKDALKFNSHNEKKLAGKGESAFGDKTKVLMHYLNSQPFLEFLQTLTGIEEPLIGDPYFEGGGQHEIKPGGLLKLHADFNKHTFLKLDRRINVLVYLNKDWKEEYGGHFELWDVNMEGCVRKFLPEFNTMAIFSTTDFSYHGHPNPLTCPPDRSRKSLALYYYSNGRPAHEINKGLEDHNTLFVGRKNVKDDVVLESPLKRLVKEVTPPFLLKMVKSAAK